MMRKVNEFVGKKRELRGWFFTFVKVLNFDKGVL